MMRMAFLYEANAHVNAQYRALMPMNMLKRRGHTVVWCGSSRDTWPLRELMTCDLVHIYRAAAPGVLRTVEHLSRAGVAVVWDNDDDIGALSVHSPSYKRLGGLRAQRDMRWQQRLIRAVDVVTTTSDALVRYFMSVGARHATLVENYVPPEFVVRKPERGHFTGITIGWAGLREHEADAKLLSMDRVLADMLDGYPDARLITVCLSLGFKHERYERLARVPFAQMPDVISKFDIGLAPLADIPFNRARSNVKLKEYAVAGVPWLASPVGEYAHLGGRHGGRLVADDAWSLELSRMITRRRARHVLGARGKLWARTQTIDRRVDEWEKVFFDAISRVRRLPRAARA